MEAYSPATGQTYESWDALVAAESNGWVATVILTNGRDTWPYVVGPVADRAEANRIRHRLRRNFKKGSPDHPNTTVVTTAVRPAWKPEAA